MSNEETVTITKKEYEELLKAADMLMCLEGCGVDNWCCYDDAIEMYNNLEKE